MSQLIFSFTGSNGIDVNISNNNVEISYTGWMGTGFNGVNSGNLTGIFYPRYDNPKGYITKAWLTGLAKSGDLENVNNTLQFQIDLINNSTGDFITTSQTGQFSGLTNTGILVTDAELFNVQNNLQSQIDNIPLSYYPLDSNPAGYITGINTDNFVLKSQTGNFVTDNQISNFVSDLETGIFSTKSYVDNISGVLAEQIITGNSTSGTLVKITGSTNQSSVNITGIGSTKIFLNGNNVLISGSTTPIQTSGSVTIVGGATILNGQLLIGNASDNSFTQGNLKAGSGISITSGVGNLTINCTITGGGPSLSVPIPYFWEIKTKGSNYTVGSGDFTIIHTGSSVATFTLPSAIGISGRLWIIKNAANANTTVMSSSLIYVTGDSTSVTFNSGDALSFHSDGIKYYAH